MKVGDLVRYRGWEGALSGPAPVGIVIEVNGDDSNYFHSRVRVMWSGTELPIQAKVLSVNCSRVTRWVHPKHFEIIKSD